jgi:hypothetical protein
MPLLCVLVLLALGRISNEMCDVLGQVAAVVAAMGNDPFLELAPKRHCIHVSQLLQTYFRLMTYNHQTLSSRLKVQQR